MPGQTLRPARPVNLSEYVRQVAGPGVTIGGSNAARVRAFIRQMENG